MRLRTRLQQLERKAASLIVPLLEEAPDEAWSAWFRGGCRGPLPPAESRPAKYTPEQWGANHRFFLALCCRSVGRPDPPQLTEQERREVDEATGLFASVGLRDELSLRQQADLAPYASVLAQLLTDAGGGVVPPEYARGGVP